MGVEHYSPSGAVGELRLHLPDSADSETGERVDGQLSAQPVRGDAAVAAFQRDGAALGKFDCGARQPDYQDDVSFRDSACRHLPFVAGEQHGSDGVNRGGGGVLPGTRESGARNVAVVRTCNRAVWRGTRVDHGSAAGLFARHGADGDSDVRPSPVEGTHSPIHALALPGMGIPLLDNVYLEELAAHCAEAKRWTFQIVVAPLNVPGGTGSPVNPVAIF